MVRWAVVAGVMLTSAASAGTAGALTFSAPAQIAGPPYASTHRLTALDCVSTSLCVAGDSAGDLITATDPTAGASAWTEAAQVDPDARITAVSCASTTLCVAAAGDGALLHSSDPTAGASAWKLAAHVLGGGDGLTSLSCPSAQLCVGVDRHGAVVSSRTPTGGARTWKTTRVVSTPKDWLTGIACPSISECIAVNRRGTAVWHTTDPTGNRHAWHASTLDTGQKTADLTSVSCPSTSLCVITGHRGFDSSPFLGTSTDPAGGSSSWRVEPLPVKTADALSVLTVSCPTTSFCSVGAGTWFNQTAIVASTNPSQGAGSYQQTLYNDDNESSVSYPALAGLSCASASQCVFLGTGGEVGATSTPLSTSITDWPAFTVDGYNGLESVSCPSATECLAGGSAHVVYTTSHPTGGTSAWSTAAVPIAADRVACGAIDQCVVADGSDGDLAATATPLTGGWTEAETSGDLPDGGGIAVLSCTAGPFCIAGPYEVQSDSDSQGTSALTTTNPTGGTSAWDYHEWIEGGINGGRRAAHGTVRSLACPSQKLCVAGDAKGGILTNTTPANAAAWQYTQADGTASINGLSCPSASLCVGVDSQGRVIHSTNPTGGGWSKATIDTGDPLTAVSCAGTSFCVAVDGDGHAFLSTHPTGGAAAWHRSNGIDRDLTSIACPSSRLCVAVDARGDETTAGAG